MARLSRVIIEAVLAAVFVGLGSLLIFDVSTDEAPDVTGFFSTVFNTRSKMRTQTSNDDDCKKFTASQTASLPQECDPLQESSENIFAKMTSAPGVCSVMKDQMGCCSPTNTAHFEPPSVAGKDCSSACVAKYITFWCYFSCSTANITEDVTCNGPMRELFDACSSCKILGNGDVTNPAEDYNAWLADNSIEAKEPGESDNKCVDYSTWPVRCTETVAPKTVSSPAITANGGTVTNGGTLTAPDAITVCFDVDIEVPAGCTQNLPPTEGRMTWSFTSSSTNAEATLPTMTFASYRFWATGTPNQYRVCTPSTPLADLNGAGTYKFRAYASNTFGETSGEEVSFTLSATTPTVAALSGVNVFICDGMSGGGKTYTGYPSWTPPLSEAQFSGGLTVNTISCCETSADNDAWGNQCGINGQGATNELKVNTFNANMDKDMITTIRGVKLTIVQDSFFAGRVELSSVELTIGTGAAATGGATRIFGRVKDWDTTFNGDSSSYIMVKKFGSFLIQQRTYFLGDLTVTLSETADTVASEAGNVQLFDSGRVLLTDMVSWVMNGASRVYLQGTNTIVNGHGDGVSEFVIWIDASKSVELRDTSGFAPCSGTGITGNGICSVGGLEANAANNGNNQKQGKIIHLSGILKQESPEATTGDANTPTIDVPDVEDEEDVAEAQTEGILGTDCGDTFTREGKGDDAAGPDDTSAFVEKATVQGRRRRQPSPTVARTFGAAKARTLLGPVNANSVHQCCGAVCAKPAIIRGGGDLQVVPTGTNKCVLATGIAARIVQYLRVFPRGTVTMTNVEEGMPYLDITAEPGLGGGVTNGFPDAQTFQCDNTGCSTLQLTMSNNLKPEEFEVTLVKWASGACSDMTLPALVVTNRQTNREPKLVCKTVGGTPALVLIVPRAPPTPPPQVNTPLFPSLSSYCVYMDISSAEFPQSDFLAAINTHLGIDTSRIGGNPPSEIFTFYGEDADRDGDTRAQFKCNDLVSQASADSTCQRIMDAANQNGHNFQQATKATGTCTPKASDDDHGSNKALFALMALALIPILLIFACCLFCKNKTRKADNQYMQDTATFSNVAAAPQNITYAIPNAGPYDNTVTKPY